MKFYISSTALSGRLQSICRVINSKNALPILDCFLFEVNEGTLTVTASDSETTLITSLEVSDCDADGRFALTAKTVIDALKELPELSLTFDINMETHEVSIAYQNGQYKMMAQNADEYPSVPALSENAARLTMSADVLLGGVNRCSFAVADDELRPVMNGIYFDITPEELVMVASDGHKLVRCRSFATKGNERSAFVLPKKPAMQLRNLLPKETGDVKIAFDQRSALFTMENYLMSCRLIEGRYPNYNSVIPKNNPHRATADRLALLGAMKRVAVFSSQASSLIKLSVTSNRMEVSAQDIDYSTSAIETLECTYDGDEISIGFKGSFLIDILSNMTSNEVSIELADPSRAGVFEPEEQGEDEELLMLLMPMMLNE
ncbi:MAG: DNA polymerase III subunit beta [Mediterranea sp.]|nr:DNA polymerase III subunit beta [Mediterranea sp.]